MYNSKICPSNLSLYHTHYQKFEAATTRTTTSPNASLLNFSKKALRYHSLFLERRKQKKRTKSKRKKHTMADNVSYLASE